MTQISVLKDSEAKQWTIYETWCKRSELRSKPPYSFLQTLVLISTLY